MDHWINDLISLAGETVTLIPLNKDHLPELSILAKDNRIWEYYAFDGSDSKIFMNVYTAALNEKEKGNQFPFVIFHNVDNKIIGSTRCLDIQRLHKKLEIGATWLHPGYWATAVNIECKLLLLTYCFEELGAVRVQLKTDENNIRSRKAIEKIGGRFEGIFRNDMIRDNNTRRNSAYYSIIEEEWPVQKIKLTNLYQAKMKL
jgi:RimJ/RimL family protein N-acetyltransferase